MMETIEHCEGRIRAFTEAKELVSLITTSDKHTAEQLNILLTHFEKQIEFENQHIDITLQVMEGAEL